MCDTRNRVRWRAGEQGEAMSATDESPRGGEQLGDDLLDDLDGAFRRLRRALVKPPHTTVPVPSLGRPLELAKLLACDALADLAGDDTDRTPVTVKDVAVALQLEHSTVSRLLGDMEGDALVQRGVDDADRRRTTVALTDTGWAAVQDQRELRRLVTRAVLVGWTPQDATTLTTLLDRLADAVVAQVPELVERARAGFLATG